MSRMSANHGTSTYNHIAFGSVTRGKTGKHLSRRGKPPGPYPRIAELVERAEKAGLAGANATADAFDDLFMADLLYANSITALKLLESGRVREANANLTGMIKRGLLNRESREVIGEEGEVNAMRFAAACATQLLDMETDTMDSVCSPSFPRGKSLTSFPDRWSE